MFKRSLFNHHNPTGQSRFRRDLGAIAIGLLVASFALGVQGASAAENAADELNTSTSANSEERVATSRGIANNPNSQTLKAAPTDSIVTVKPRNPDQAKTGASATPKSGLFSDFEIFDADVTLYFDDDLDGHYYGIDVNFDADTDYAAADVYARLYLSLEGGPWELYYTTEVFTLFGDSGNDDYTVETELYSGYPTAYYDVLIELYDWETDAFVAEFGPADSIEMDDAPLEDQLKDAGIVTIGSEPIVSHSHGGGGSMSLFVLFLLLATTLLRYRKHAERSPITPHSA